MKRLLRITVLFSVTLLWWGEKGYAATPAMDAAEKETVSATVEAEADKKDPKSDKKSDEPKRKRNLGHLSGSFETNTIYYVEDSKTGAVVPHNSYGSNNFLKLDYQLGRFSAGVQLEYYPHPLVGTPMQGYEYVMEGFSINNLTEKYISWTDRNYSVTVGDFYEQFGSGLILRAWEDRALGFNNSLGGARVTFNIKDIVEGKVLYAFPRFNLGYLSTQIAGGDLSFSLSNAIGLLDHRLSLEGSIVNRHFKNLPSWYTEYRDDYDFDLSKNVISYSGRVNYEYRGLSAKFEYVGKSKDVYLDNMTGEEVFKRGDAQLFEIGYTGSNYAVMAQFRRLNYMQSQLYRPDGGSGSLGLLPGNTINYIPALSPQHTYMLAGLDPNSPQQNGEIGGQIDAFYTFRRGTAIGGKRGLKIHANYARYYSINGTMSKPGTNFYYRDFSFDIDKSWNSKLRSELDGQTAKIRATVRFQQAGNYKIACVLTENDIQKTNNETLPVFNHVLRAALTNMEGDPIAPAVAEAGERSFDFEVSLNNGWDSQNCEFVIYVFKEEEDAAFVVNNGAVCPVGGKVDYKYESVK